MLLFMGLQSQTRMSGWTELNCSKGFPGGSAGKDSACSVGDLDLIPGLGRSPGEGKGYPLQYSCPENPMGKGAWQVAVPGVTRVGHDLATKPQ